MIINRAGLDLVPGCGVAGLRHAGEPAARRRSAIPEAILDGFSLRSDQGVNPRPVIADHRNQIEFDLGESASVGHIHKPRASKREQI